jgi:hypothetical protein
MAAAPATESASERSPFVAALMRSFDAWDADHDGTLTPAEIDRAVLDPAVTGDAAAVAASLKVVARSTRLKVPPLTKGYFAQYAASPAAGQVAAQAAVDATIDPDRPAAGGGAPGNGATSRPTAPSNAPKWDLLFAASRRRIATNSRPTTGPAVDHDALVAQIRQGALNDCFLLAVTGAMIHRDGTPPTGWAKSRGADGSIRAHFGDGSPSVIVPPTTTAELALGGTVEGGGGRWLTELEEAFGHHRAAVIAATQPSAVTTREGTDAITHGGNPGPCMVAMTGHGFRVIHPGLTASRRSAVAPNLLPQIRTALTRALSERRLAVVGVALPSPDGPDALPSPPNITHNHAYAVLAFDPATDVLTLWNPHGQAFTPDGTPGVAHGYPTEHGRFSLPLAQAYQFIGGFYFEQDGPPGPDGPGF